MNYNHFLINIKGIIQEKLGIEYDIETQKIQKNNGIMLDGIIIKKKIETIAPTIDLNMFYDQLEDGAEIDDIADEIISIYRENAKISMKISEELLDFTNLKDMIAFKLIQEESNREFLKTVPYIEFLDLAIVFYLVMGESEKEKMTALIHNSHMKIWNTTKNELYKLAKKNTPHILPASIKTIREVMCNILKGNCEEIFEPGLVDDIFIDRSEEDMLYVVTNQSGINGACCMLYEECLETFAKEHKSDLIILPSSIHEVLLITDKGNMDYIELREMVKQINETEVPDEDVLSDKIYRYSLDTGKISIVE